jgi:hypothetical protein
MASGDDLDLYVDADDESFETMTALAAAHRWGDGLPLVPPTETRVAAMLDGRDGDEVLGVLPPRRSEVTVLAVAVNAVMAGCHPTTFPVVAAAVRALCDPAMNLEGVQATTHPVAPLVIVHGEMVREGGFNGGLGAFGPGNPSNASVGRAVRLVLMHLGDARPGDGDQSTQGGPAKYTYCIAENDEATPWESYPESVGVHARSAVTVACHEGPHNVEDHVSRHAPSLLATVGSVATSLGSNNTWVPDGELFVVLGPEHAATIGADGWTRNDIAMFLYEEMRLPLGLLHYREWSGYGDEEREARTAAWPKWMRAFENPQRLVPLTLHPSNFRVVVSGGAGKHSSVIPSWGKTKSITLPVD